MSSTDIETTRSAPTIRAMGRPPVQQERIIEAIRGKIVRGTYAPGSRLPIRRDMCRKFDASAQTVQAALDTLSEQGFVEARGTRGTFVSDHPPHLANYALVFGGRPGDVDKPRFWTALANEVTRLREVDGVRVRALSNINGRPDNEDYVNLIREVKQRRLAGLMFVGITEEIFDSPLIEEPGMPRVKVGGWWLGDSPIATVTTDIQSLFAKALEHFASHGRRKVAILCHPGVSPDCLKPSLMDWSGWLFPMAKRLGLEIDPAWVQSPAPTFPETAARLSRLLLSGPADHRPDALFIADDNFVEYATAGVVAAGVSVPNELQIVAHCNFPWPAPSVLPVRRLGYDCRRLMRMALDSLSHQRRGEAAGLTTILEAHFEDELSF
jgi:DNA-binding LacI/PurR family transcriptional regulator